MIKDLAGRVVAITGASAGIGRATAVRAAEAGAHVVLSARRADRLETIVHDIQRAGGQAVACPGDVTQPIDMQHLAAAAIKAFGRIDVMICNAGIGYHGGLEETPAEDMRRVVDVNLMGTFYAAQAALIAMRQQGSGHVIAVSSIVGRRGVGGSSVYSATKAAQVAFIESLRADFVGTAFHASVIFPVSTTTEFHEAMTRDFGHHVEGRGPKQSADTVARAIVACIRAPKAEVYPFPKAWWLAVLSVIAPGQADRIVQRFGRRRIAEHPGPHDDAGS
ncbi:MAG: SDR family oxidoreductase [Vicinamibacterales bacterium]